MSRIHKAAKKPSAPSAVRTVDISFADDVLCPNCRGWNIRVGDQAALSPFCSIEHWLCQDCGQPFVLYTRAFLAYEEVDGHEA